MCGVLDVIRNLDSAVLVCRPKDLFAAMQDAMRNPPVTSSAPEQLTLGDGRHGCPFLTFCAALLNRLELPTVEGAWESCPVLLNTSCWRAQTSLTDLN